MTGLPRGIFLGLNLHDQTKKYFIFVAKMSNKVNLTFVPQHKFLHILININVSHQKFQRDICISSSPAVSRLTGTYCVKALYPSQNRRRQHPVLILCSSTSHCDGTVGIIASGTTHRSAQCPPPACQHRQSASICAKDQEGGRCKVQVSSGVGSV